MMTTRFRMCNLLSINYQSKLCREIFFENTYDKQVLKANLRYVFKNAIAVLSHNKNKTKLLAF